jgi:HlyD family secretion protein
MIRTLSKAGWLVVLLLPALVLQGCAPDDAQATATSPAPSFLARGIVDVQGGLVSVRPRRTGQLIEITAASGQDVSRGTVLAKLQGETQNAEADAARADVVRARAELASERMKVATLSEALARVREAVRLGAESEHVRDELQAQLDAQTSALPVAQASIAAAEAHLRAAQFVADSTAVRAPIDGRVVQLNARVGDLVNATDGPALFLVRPHAALIVRASVASHDASHIHVGSVASVSDADDSETIFAGRVLSLGELARKPDPTVAADDFTSERVVDCIIELAPGANLRIGSLVLVSFK